MINSQPLREKPHKGATAVEFALFFFVLVMLSYTTIEFARFHLVRQAVNQACYEAARWSLVPDAASNEGKMWAEELLSPFGVSDIQVAIFPPTITEDTPSIRVEIQVPMNKNGGAIFPKQYHPRSVYFANRTNSGGAGLEHYQQLPLRRPCH